MKLVQAVALLRQIPRREASKLIDDEMVKVNGQPATSYSLEIDEERDSIEIGNRKYNIKVKKNKLFAYYKPKGIISTLAEGKNTLLPVVQKMGTPNLKPIGRLDAESEGLLLLTNDGDFINSILHPSKHVPKIYKVIASGFKDPEQKRALAALVKLRNFSVDRERVTFEVELEEGKNRQVRRACSAAGMHAEKLVRISIGAVQLGDLKPGSWIE
ncbi:MAG: pseudouridine synthase, partial [Candidatus Caenarcaniphilales bacterium]|nr:pseudouridine synthase [Candidatus Caenarcaniphilales bacterium]